jgi:oligopeptide transport system permease protein
VSRDKTWLRPLTLDDLTAGPAQAPSYWGLALKRLLRNRLAVAGLILIAVLVAVALLAPLIAPDDPSQQNLTADGQYQGPSWSHLMGTDGLGRDWFSRVVYGTRVSLAVGIFAQLVVLGIGLPLGLLAGIRNGPQDGAIMRFTDLAYAFPELLLVILLRGVIGGSLTLLIVIIGVVTWMDVTRLVRGQVLTLREREFVTASRAFGAGDRHVMTRHLLPNLAGPLVVILAIGVPRAIFIEATLSFIGYGVAIGTPSWGSMVQEGYAAFAFPHLMLFPAGAIALLMLAFTFVGDGLRDALDPTADAGGQIKARGTALKGEGRSELTATFDKAA